MKKVRPRKSGYPQTFRHQVVKSAVVKYEKMCKVEDEGGRPMYRSREWHESARRMEKERKLVSWHQTEKDTVSAPLILDPTAGGLTSKIKLLCQKFEKTSGFRILVKERAGDAVRQDARSEPLRNRSCGREDCLCCSSGKPGSCEVNSVGYRIQCRTCQRAGRNAIYEGESGRNAYSRGLEHQQDLQNEKEDSPLWKHCTLEHNHIKVNFSMKTLKSYKSCLDRQVNESVRVTNSRAHALLNSKNEFHQTPIIRIVAASGLHGEQGESQEATISTSWRGRGQRGGRARGAGRGRRMRG